MEGWCVATIIWPSKFACKIKPTVSYDSWIQGTVLRQVSVFSAVGFYWPSWLQGRPACYSGRLLRTGLQWLPQTEKNWPSSWRARDFLAPVGSDDEKTGRISNYHITYYSSTVASGMPDLVYSMYTRLFFMCQSFSTNHKLSLMTVFSKYHLKHQTHLFLTLHRTTLHHLFLFTVLPHVRSSELDTISLISAYMHSKNVLGSNDHAALS